jgi:hypothetical protein
LPDRIRGPEHALISLRIESGEHAGKKCHRGHGSPPQLVNDAHAIPAELSDDAVVGDMLLVMAQNLTCKIRIKSMKAVELAGL